MAAFGRRSASSSKSRSPGSLAVLGRRGGDRPQQGSTEPVRAIATRLGRSSSTVAPEVAPNGDVQAGYRELNDRHGWGCTRSGTGAAASGDSLTSEPIHSDARFEHCIRARLLRGFLTLT